MNERIKELAVQADLLIKKTNGDEFRYGNFDPKFQKFAELIVKECVEIADKSNQGSKSSNEGTEFYYNADIGDKIKQHFGVEE